MIHRTAFLCLCLLLKIVSVTGEVKTVSVMEGDSVTLHTDVTHIQTDDHILWMFGPQETRIAEIYKQIIYIYGRLQLNQTGSLTITNITITDSGLYKQEIINNRGTSYKRFNVTVYAHLPVPVIIRVSPQCSSSSERSSSSTCVLLCSVMNVTHVTLSWYKGNSLFSSISASDLNIRLSLPLEVEYQDTNTYSCVLNNPIRNQTQHLHITDVCQTDSDLSQHSHLILLLSVAVTVFLIIVIAVIYRHYKNCKQQATKDKFSTDIAHSYVF